MPANLTPEYHKADKRYKEAATDAERITALEDMLRVIPKHKGTEHMRADLKKRLSKFKAAEQSAKHSGGKSIDIFHFPKSGAGQLVLIGTPNSGKSSIVAALSKARVHIADYPFSTQTPAPGMMHYEDVPIEIIDTPPITADFSTPGQVGVYRGCDIIAIVIDLSADTLEQMQICLDYLDSHKLLINDKEENHLGKKTFVICTKKDLADDDSMQTLKELCDRNFDFIEISLQTGDGLDEFVSYVFKTLDVVRVYAKKPHKDPDMKEPFTLPTGSTVEDLAMHIHRDLGEKLKSARAWGADVHPGQQVHKTHVLKDKDIIELHFP
jgi:small GTP-binding protein